MMDFDAFYTAFEDRFRGSFETIKQRAHVYLEELPSGTGKTALDLGCGRGEWLELLTEKGFAAQGVDSNRKFASAGSNRGLNITIGDLFDVAAVLPDRSFDVISAFHVIEHLPLEKQLLLLSEAHRLLRPDGIFIAEWPNVCNFDVMRSGFWLDPTHTRPLPLELVQFMAEYSGFGNVSPRTFRRSTSDVVSDHGNDASSGFVHRVKMALGGSQFEQRILKVLVESVNAGEDVAIVARKGNG